MYSEVIGQTVDDLAFLMEYDTDSFCRWDASQELATRAVLTMLGVIPPGSNSKQRDAAAQLQLVNPDFWRCSSERTRHRTSRPVKT